MARRSDVPEVHRRWERLLLPLLLVVGAVLIVIGLGSMLRRGVEREISQVAGEWDLLIDHIPAWIPAGFRGRLIELRTLPQRLTLRSSHWKQQLTDEIEANPWVHRVAWLKRDADGIEFEAEFVRPVVGIVGDGGCYLCDSEGRVIDFQPGELSPAWQVPEYRPEAGELAAGSPGKLSSGTLLDDVEYVELFSLLLVLWEAGIYERWSVPLHRINNRKEPGDDRFWLIEVRDGPDLDWGRAPASRRVAALTPARKLVNLERTLRVLPKLQEVPRVRLWEAAGPLVGVER